MSATSPTRVAILGSTGSVGRQALDVIAAHPDRLRAVALVAGSDEAAVRRQVHATGAARWGLGSDIAVEIASSDEVDVVLNAIVGVAGLRASIAALESGKRLALANKESLVAAGRACKRAASRGGGTIVPVDSEHAALAQCLARVDRAAVDRVVVTASGGPFRTRSDLSGVTPAEALEHPTWSMGPKITVDSATLMNKGLEVIEAHHLFDIDVDRIEIVVHPQSLVHAIVHLVDGTSLMQVAPTDMRIPIQAALTWPRRDPTGFAPVDLAGVGSLTFEPVDRARFGSIDLAYAAARAGDGYPAALNAANEEAVGAFLDGTLRFVDIPRVVASVLDGHDAVSDDDVDVVMEVDARSRTSARKIIAELHPRSVS